MYLRFAMVFLLVNLIGFAGYYIHPAAPPWYAMNYGFEPILDTPGNVAEEEGFDELLGCFHLQLHLQERMPMYLRQCPRSMPPIWWWLWPTRLWTAAKVVDSVVCGDYGRYLVDGCLFGTPLSD